MAVPVPVKQEHLHRCVSIGIIDWDRACDESLRLWALGSGSQNFLVCLIAFPVMIPLSMLLRSLVCCLHDSTGSTNPGWLDEHVSFPDLKKRLCLPSQHRDEREGMAVVVEIFVRDCSKWSGLSRVTSTEAACAFEP